MAERRYVKRRKDCIDEPPPHYAPDSGLCTLSLYWRGQMSPDLSKWVGGNVLKLDYAKLRGINISQLSIYSHEQLGLSLRTVLFGRRSERDKFFSIRTNDELYSCLYGDELQVYVIEGDETESLGLVEVIDEDGVVDLDAAIQSEDAHFQKERNRKGKNVAVEDANLESIREEESDDASLFDSDYDLEEDSKGDDDILFSRNVDAGVEWLGTGGEDQVVEADLGGDELGSGDEDLALSDDDFPSYVDGEGEGETRAHVYVETQKYTPHFQLGMVFGTKKEFRELVDSHSIIEGRSVYYFKSDKSRVYARCYDKNCLFKINLRRKKNDTSFEITTLFPDHSCVRDYNVRNMNSNWLSGRFGYQWKNDAKRNVEGFRTSVVKEVRCHVSWWQAYNAKKKALHTGLGDGSEQYALLRSYANEVLRSNPESTVLVGVEQVGGQNKFSRFYMCVAALKEGFLKACRPLFGVDGTFLKGPHGGILLTAVGLDPNNNLYPFAWAVVNKEDGANWEWFFMQLKEDLGIVREAEWTIISDKQKGLIKAVGEVFPCSSHRFCVGHMHSNFMNAGFRGQAFKIALWRTAKATTINYFARGMEDIKKMDEKAFDWLKDKHPEQWSRSHFGTHPKCDILLNNLCESFNARILRAREMPILNMLESIMSIMMERLVKCRERGENWKGPFCPKIQKIIDFNKSKIPDCQPIKSSDRYYQVSCFDGTQYAVDLEKWTCGCRKWDLTGIPCKHALSAIACQRANLERFVHPYYKVESYRDAYRACILPMNGRNEWEPSNADPVLPPKLIRQAGRPPKARRREKDELVPRRKRKNAGRPVTLDGQKKKRNQDTLSCGRCGGRGHNKRSCQKRDDDQTMDRQDEAALEELNAGVDLYSEGTQLDDGAVTQEHVTDDLDISDEYLMEIDEIIKAHSASQPTMHERDEDLGVNVGPITQPNIKERGKKKQKGVKIRAPPPFVGNQLKPPSFEIPTQKIGPVVRKGAHKYLVLSVDEDGDVGKCKRKR